MEILTKLLKAQLSLLKPFVVGCSLSAARRSQDKLGALMATIHKSEVSIEDIKICEGEAAMITPKDELSESVILYLHGGGYTCGDLTYSKGFGSVLASKCGIKVLCSAYRLAPEFPYPAALEDAYAAYKYLTDTCGYKPSQIVLSGESAGGGLIFSLCLKLKELGEPQPAGIIAISPWTDLTLSGGSFETNKDVDPSMTQKRLKYFADCYVHGDTNGVEDEQADAEKKKDPLISPIFGKLGKMPPSLIFVGGDEVMLDDARVMHEKLISARRSSKLVVKPEMWHAYVLYGLKENEGDFDVIRSFLKKVLPNHRKLRWLKLDNAAKIYPAAKRRNWSNLFRLSATLEEPVDREVLKSALDVTVRRFPSIAVRIRHGFFWYYLEEIDAAPKILEEKCHPLVRMPFDDIRKCAFRILVYKNRIALEVFHAVTDGNGGLIFLKTLLAEYLTEKYGVVIPSERGVFDRLEEPKDEELEDSFLKNCGAVAASRKEASSYKINGTLYKDNFLNDTTLIMDADAVKTEARKYGVSVTAFLTAAMIIAVAEVQKQKGGKVMRRKPVRILVPVNLRKLYGSKTLRNFVLYVTPDIDTRMGDYTFKEVVNTVHHYMKMEITPKAMSKRITTNVNSEKHLIVKIMPLFVKNIVMKAIFDAVGEKKSCFSFSNLGEVELPDAMKPYITRFDFVLGIQLRSPQNCGVITYGGKLYVNFIRNIIEPDLEYNFFKVLRGLGIKVRVESNFENSSEDK